MEQHLPAFQYLFDGKAIILTPPAGTSVQVLPANPLRWSLSFFHTNALLVGPAFSVWPSVISGLGGGIDVPTSGLILQANIHGAIVGGPWYLFNGGTGSLAMIEALWRG